MSTVPRTISRVRDACLRVVWADGHESTYPWEWLRRACPCAACRAAGGGPALRAAPTPPSADIRPLAIDPVGRYALHVAWSDGHATGIYSFEYLRQTCPCTRCRPPAAS